MGTLKKSFAKIAVEISVMLNNIGVAAGTPNLLLAFCIPPAKDTIAMNPK